MARGLSIKMKSGKPATGATLRDLYIPALWMAGLAAQAVFQRGTPVGLTGHLRRNWVTSKPIVNGNKVTSKVGNPTIYGPRVNRTSKRNKGFIERAAILAKPEAIAAFKNGLGDVASKFWTK